MNCSNCGTYNNPGVNYCINCGTQLINTGGIPPINNNINQGVNNQIMGMNQMPMYNGQLGASQPVMNNGMGTITFNRTNSMLGFALVFTVIVDGNVMGKIKRGETLTLNIPYGIHNLQLKSGLSKVDSTITIGDNSRNLVFKCYVGMGFLQGNVKLELVNYYN